MRRKKNWLPVTLIALAGLGFAVAAHADLVCPGAGANPMITIGASHIVPLVLATVLPKGVGVLLLGTTAVVGLPWLVAGVAVAMLHAPRRFRA